MRGDDGCQRDERERERERERVARDDIRFRICERGKCEKKGARAGAGLDILILGHTCRSHDPTYEPLRCSLEEPLYIYIYIL